MTYHIDPRDTQDPRDEAAIQTLFRNQMRTAFPHVMLVAIPNAGRRSAWEQRQRNREGMVSGFPDLAALHNGKAAFLEFKSGTGSLATTQKDVLARLQRLGFPVGVFRKPETAVDWVREALAL